MEVVGSPCGALSCARAGPKLSKTEIAPVDTNTDHLRICSLCCFPPPFSFLPRLRAYRAACCWAKVTRLALPTATVTELGIFATRHCIFHGRLPPAAIDVYG